MEGGRAKVWLPAILAGSGTDVFTRRLAAALERNDITAQISWFPLSHELLPLLLRRARPPDGTDIIIANSWNAFAFRHLGLPLVVVVHHCVFDPELQPYKSISQSVYHRFFAEPREARSLRSADSVIAVSQYVANHLLQKTGMNNVKVIYNWVDTELFKPKQQEISGDRPFRLLFVGKPTRLKGGDMLAPLMRELGRGVELHFTAVSHDHLNINLPDNMIPVGKLSERDMIRAYQACDALLLPSRAEGFGYSALEAMACGKPVIASKNSALLEIVDDGVTGILCDMGDVGHFANACRLLADDPELCSAMGNAGRQRAVKSFSEVTSIECYINLMHEFLVPEKASR